MLKSLPFLNKSLTFKGDHGPLEKRGMCLNVICEVLAILAIGLVNFSCVGLSGFEIQGPESET